MFFIMICCRSLSIQIQKIQSNVAIENIETLLQILHSLKKAEEIIDVSFHRSANYCNIVFESNEIASQWKKFAKLAAENPTEFHWLRSRWIVVAEGKNGWSDYVLLAHYEPTAVLERFVSDSN